MQKNILFYITITMICTTAILLGQTMNNYCSVPPFVGGSGQSGNQTVIPNVFICQDFTGSMRFWVSGPGDYSHILYPYDPTRSYYGYADPNSRYEIVSWGGLNYYRKNPAGAYLGNQINWWHMTRIDVARKVLTGGKGPAYNDKSRLLFEETYYRVNASSGSHVYGILTTDTSEISIGVVRQIADLDSNYVWDTGAPKFALQTFSTYSPFYRRVKCPFGSSLIAFLDSLERSRPNGGTWCGDAIFEGIHYYRFTQAHYNDGPWPGQPSYAWNINQVGTPIDPWYDLVGDDTVSVSCRPSFFIFLSDGESNSDNPVSDCGHLPHPASPYGAGAWGFRYYNGPDSSDGTHGCADDYAYYAHVTDLRPDGDPIYGIPDRQSLTFFSIFLFASPSGAVLSKNIAIYGGFIDAPADTPGTPGYLKPDKFYEYDADTNGIPDNYFYADEGYALEQAFKDIFIRIQVLSRVTSASGVAITGSGTRGSGLVYNAQFYPRLDLTTTLSLSWIGRASALWIDPYGYLREESEGNLNLHLKNDYIVEMFYDNVLKQTVAARFQDTSGLGHFIVPIDTVVAESLRAVWDASKLLLTATPDTRRIFYHRPGTGRQNFIIGDNWLDPHLAFGNADQCDSLIQYVRGYQYLNWRTRELLPGNIWRLGDVIHSSPIPVGEPSEGYHMIYGDNSYFDFYDHFRDRRTIIYTGANDGMIHAFNAGHYDDLDSWPIAGTVNGLGLTLGQELWSWIPYNVLPHLKWLKDTVYCHVYYNDLKPYPTDMQIFPDSSAQHPSHWGTVLVNGMRFGGGEITVGPNTYRSAYTCFDVSDPEFDGRQPQFMWEFTHPNLGYTMCIPAVIKITDNIGNDNWLLLFGSGPQTLLAECTQPARIFVVDPYTGALVHTHVIADSNTAITNMFSADFGLQYWTNLAYYGTYDNSGGGKIYRIMTHQNPDPTAWSYENLVIDVGRPITAEGSVATDDLGNLWIYFGTGRYYTNLDVADTTHQLFLGVKDDTTNTNTPFTFADLVNVTNVSVFSDSVGGLPGVTNFDELVFHVQNHAGWYIEFDSIPGERVVTSPLILGGAVLFTSFIPNPSDSDTTGVPIQDLCIGEDVGPQAGNLWALFYTTGTAYKTAMLDTTPSGEHITHIGIVGDMPSEPALHISSDQEKVFIQSAGGLIGVETPLPYNPRGGVVLWRGR